MIRPNPVVLPQAPSPMACSPLVAVRANSFRADSFRASSSIVQARGSAPAVLPGTHFPGTPLNAVGSYGHFQTGTRQEGFTLVETMLTMAAIALLTTAVFVLYNQANGSTQGVSVEQENIAEIGAAAQAVYGSQGTYAGISTSDAVNNGVFPDSMLVYRSSSGIIFQPPCCIRPPAAMVQPSGAWGGAGASHSVMVQPSFGIIHLPPIIPVTPPAPLVQSVWGQPVNVSPATVNTSSDALSIDYEGVPAAACPVLAQAVSNSMWDVQVDGRSLIIDTAAGRTLDAAALASQCAEFGATANMSFIRYTGLSGTQATAAPLAVLTAAPPPPPPPPVGGTNLPPAAPAPVAPPPSPLPHVPGT